MDAEFWAARRTFLPPIPELDFAAGKLSESADMLLAGDLGRAREAASAADISRVREYAQRIMGATDPTIHRFRLIPKPTAEYRKVEARMPKAAVKVEIAARDGFRCRFCECRVILPGARRRMVEMLPGTVHWAGPDSGKHAGFYALSATIDHVTPHATGGDNSPENLLTTCQPCNFGRNNWRLEEVGLLDPRLRPPKIDDWDGLRRLLDMPEQGKLSPF